MQKTKSWHWTLIFTVILLTAYHILPTLFYYLQPLKSPLTQTHAMKTAESIASRLNDSEKEAIEWLNSYCELLGITPGAIGKDTDNPQILRIQLTKGDDASRLRAYLPRAGALIPHAPAHLTVLPTEPESKTVLVKRALPAPIDLSQLSETFVYTPKTLQDGSRAPLYLDFIYDRASTIAEASDASELSALLAHPSEENLLAFATHINEMSLLVQQSPLLHRFCANLSSALSNTSLDQLLQAFTTLRDEIKRNKPTDPVLVQAQGEKASTLLLAESFLKKNRSLIQSKRAPLTYSAARSLLEQDSRQDLQSLPLSSVFFSSLTIHWEHESISLAYHPEFLALTANASKEDADRLEQLLINEIARIARLSDESFQSQKSSISTKFHQLQDTQGLLLFQLERIASQSADNLLQLLQKHWHPKHPDLLQERFPIVRASALENLDELQKKLCLCIYAPLADGDKAPAGLKNSSIYVVATGLGRILEQARLFPDNENNKLLQQDINSLAELLHRCGLNGSPTASGDYAFEATDLFATTLAATREDFVCKGSKRKAVLECSTLEQRILAENKIDTRIHQDLLKWRDEYNATRVDASGRTRFDVPKPTKSVFWSNVCLTVKKILRGDERKIIRWGLDLSGGKTVQIELRDANNRQVSSEADLKQGINELYNRVNKMGVSEVAIRQAGNQIVLDFPGSQSLTAHELVRASSMVFHIVNETFSSHSPQLSQAVNQFLQEVWNEALVKNRKDPESINQIAYNHLQKASPSARILVEHGLQLQPPGQQERSSVVDETFSKIALLRGKDFTDWFGQTHPLLIVFANYALEGSNLSHIHSSYDPSKGNYLSFDVKSSSTRGEKRNPQSDLSAWTSRFSKEGIAGTNYEAPTRGAGWRMAVLLNDTVISSPVLNSALKESAMITGSFTQSEVTQLVSDLKAGSLTFTPHILSEKNVSPELGQSDRAKGIGATIAALLLVIFSMVAYYRFAGFVASVAVLFNLLIMWAILQNIQATLTLAGIAGIILTVGMAVDANVLVFERIKEEYALTKRISSAIQAGYQKAFSAILDSNVTTIIAGLILLNFDSGPIKALAITLIIGIASSMFTALFMTRTYFAHWVKNPRNQTLKMSHLISGTSFNFLKASRAAFTLAIAIIAIGGSLLFLNRSTIFGMDFTGGFSVELELAQKSPSTHYLPEVERAFLNKGASSSDFQVRELNPSHHLRVFFSTNMEHEGKPFYNLGASKEQNPRIEWIRSALAASDISLSQDQLDANWTLLSGQMSDSMRNNALIGLAIAFGFIFLYLAIRFESAFAASAILCLLHDVLITLGIMGILHACKVPVQIDLNTVAALMTIVGYSLNDTIIIFDRIREERMTGSNLPLIINHAINATLSRTSITSGTTLLVLLALVFLGGSSIFSFALVMTIGVFFGTLSSWYIAAPLLLALLSRKAKEERALS